MTTKTDLITKQFEGQEVTFRVNPENGTSEVQIDPVARFCGWTKIANSGNEVVNWTRTREYLSELGVVQKCTTGDFIPEYIMYPLIGKAKNKRATKFTLWVGKVLVEIRKHGGYIADTATPEQVKKLNNKWAKQSIYLTDEIHDRKSIRKYIRECDKMKLDECINTIADIVEPMKGSIKHNLIDVAIKELKTLDKSLMKDTPKHTYIKDTATEGIIILQDIKIGKQKKRISTLEQAI